MSDVSETRPAQVVAAPLGKSRRRARRKAAPSEAALPEVALPEVALPEVDGEATLETKVTQMAESPLFALMSTALGLLERGCAELDWEKVRAAYRLLASREPPPAGLDPRALLADIRDAISGYLGNSGGQLPALECATPVAQSPAAPAAPRGPARGEYTPVRLTCQGCGVVEEVPAALRPVRAAPDDQAPNYYCNPCLVGRRGR